MSCKTHVKCVKRAGIRIPLYHRSQSPLNWREINACQILVNNFAGSFIEDAEFELPLLWTLKNRSFLFLLFDSGA